MNNLSKTNNTKDILKSVQDELFQICGIMINVLNYNKKDEFNSCRNLYSKYILHFDGCACFGKDLKNTFTLRLDTKKWITLNETYKSAILIMIKSYIELVDDNRYIKIFNNGPEKEFVNLIRNHASRLE